MNLCVGLDGHIEQNTSHPLLKNSSSASSLQSDFRGLYVRYGSHFSEISGYFFFIRGKKASGAHFQI